VTIKVVTPAQIGYWLKAERPEEALGLVVQIAIDHGMELGAEEKIYEAFTRGEKNIPPPCPVPGMPDLDVVEMVIGPNGMADKAQAWLNNHAVPEGLRFDWWEGFFILLPEVAWKAYPFLPA
jgi:hypothetical protein